MSSAVPNPPDRIATQACSIRRWSTTGAYRPVPVAGLQRNDQFGVGVHRYVRIVGRHDQLPLLLGAAHERHKIPVCELVVHIVFRLIDDCGGAVLREEDSKVLSLRRWPPTSVVNGKVRVGCSRVSDRP